MTPEEMKEAVKNDPRSMKERMLDGDLYIADDPQLTIDFERARKLMFEIVQAHPESFERGQDLIGELFGSKGTDTVVLPPVTVDYGYNVHVGNETFINTNLTALDVGEIRIGDHVQIGPNVQLLTPTHPVEPELRKAKWEAAKPIVIEDNVWLGGGVIVLPGVTIGENSVIGAGAVVARSIPKDSVAVGNPARVIKSVHDF
jgi:maltose O-acetyltransferase